MAKQEVRAINSEVEVQTVETSPAPTSNDFTPDVEVNALQTTPTTPIDPELTLPNDDAVAIAEREVARIREMNSTGQLDMRSMLENNMDRTNIRPRDNYHQTWKREDEIDEAKGLGYTFVRRQAVKDKVSGKAVSHQAIGKESGEILRIPEGVGKFIVAMEIPTEIYEHHQRVISYRSKTAYETQESAMQTITDNLNRASGSRKELVTTKTTFETGGEELLPARPR